MGASVFTRIRVLPEEPFFSNTAIPFSPVLGHLSRSGVN